MQYSTKTALEIFVEKADKLTNQEFTRFMTEIGDMVSYHYTANPQQITIQTIAPSETMNDSFILTYRMFVHGSEHIRLLDPTKPLSPELLDPSLSAEWLNQVQIVTGDIHAYLKEQPTGQIHINLVDQQGNVRTEILSRWDILETILYGDLAHETQRERLNNWLSSPFKPMILSFLMTEFRSILMNTLNGIHFLAYYARKELGLPLPN